MRSLVRRSVVALVLCWLSVPVGAQSPIASVTTAPPSTAGLSPSPAPTVTRDAKGRATIRSVRLAKALQIDGRLDEAVYTETAPTSGFTQLDPKPGAPATQNTDLWVFYDDDTVYFSVRVWEDHPERMITNDMRRDAITLANGELITLAIDTFHDRRSAYYFSVNPIGGFSEGQVANESQVNLDWNGIWRFKPGRFDGGWTIEMAIPFKTLRYPGTGPQDWGLMLQRINRWKNEVSVITPSEPQRGSAAFLLVSRFGDLVGLEPPAPGLNLEVKPYAIANVVTDRASSPPRSNDASADVGIDVKYAITPSLSSDFTYNTDFAQVEVDEQQVNLTRFSLFFPEKREFFLENSGTFSFGGTVSGAQGAAGDAPVLFYSRSIGINAGQQVPVQAGGRVTGRLGRFSIGALDIRTDDEPTTRAVPTNFSILRVKRDILRKSAIGLLASHRSVATRSTGANGTYGVDATLGFFTNLNINSYWARTSTEGRTTGDTSYRGQLEYAADRYGLQLEHLKIGANFNPEMGFLRRPNMRKNYALGRFSPRTKKNKVVRKSYLIGTASFIENTAGRLESRAATGEFNLDFQNSDKLTLLYTNSHEFLPAPFRIGPGVTLPVGSYDFQGLNTGYSFGQQRRVSGKVAVDRGSFYNGTRTTLTVSGARVQLLPQFFVEPSASLNRVDLIQGAFNTNLVGARITYSMSSYRFVSALLQWNSGTRSFATNVRMRWEYRPGSELFVVYNDTRDTTNTGFPDLLNRSFIVKVNRLFRF